MKLLFYIILLTFTNYTAYAAVTKTGKRVNPITVTWTMPVQYTDGTPLLLQDINISVFAIECSVKGIDQWPIQVISSTQTTVLPRILGDCKIELFVVDKNGVPGIAVLILNETVYPEEPGDGGFR